MKKLISVKFLFIQLRRVNTSEYKAKMDHINELHEVLSTGPYNTPQLSDQLTTTNEKWDDFTLAVYRVAWRKIEVT